MLWKVMILSLAFLMATSATFFAQAAAVPDLPFLDDLDIARATATDAIKGIHQSSKDGSLLLSFDSTYNGLVVNVNGLLDAIATDLKLNQMHTDRWTSIAKSILARADKFNEDIYNAQHRSSETIASGADPSRSSNNLSNNSQSSSAKIALSIDPVNLANFFQSIQKMKQDGQRFDDDQRIAAAQVINDSKWPDICSLHLATQLCAPSLTTKSSN